MYFLFVFNFICLGVDHDALVKLAEKQFSGLRSTYDEADVPVPRFTYIYMTILLYIYDHYLKDQIVAFVYIFFVHPL